MPQNIESVCIIDDDLIYINLVSKIIELKKLSESVLVFNNGKEALDFFLQSLQQEENEDIPQIIFLDLNMPVMDGWEFLNEFSKIKNQIRKKIDLYVVSSSIDSRDIERAKSIDIVSDYLTKPIKLNDFERILI
ncbi:CheY-like chemotaxis protein [Aquimarina sp. EL_43]|uniref:response regulator n=1 Tax=Aquimarina TaxID=290174 RepID=UPI0004702B5A|nr:MULTISPECIES: response regulator [Aquimarina]MBG6133404.1 CheY-like chemotaxis protein [Aquimarina sp. EL_35]MBG6153562.1 CheY-like chemotaxis protein [Aquimarina sp. EL_32]MBG6171718.1 CheY-like chemotaxis protein [Aquimarina sp. EL_43]